MLKYLIFFLLIAVTFSCDYFKQEDIGRPIARVNDSYLYKDDLKKLIFETTSKEDSIIIVNNFIKRWATQQLLIDRSNVNLPQKQQEIFNKLVEEYKIDLYTEAYKSYIVSSQLDSVVSDIELEKYYLENNVNFRLNDELLKVRYIHIGNNYSNITSLKNKFTRFNNTDKEDLNNLSIKFKAYNLNDSIWIKNDVLQDALPTLKSSNVQMLKKSNFVQLQDSLGVYLVKIVDVLKTNDIAPLSYVKPTIKQIILNKRKRELIKKLEKDITVDAIKNKNFEIYN
ncbi:MAG: peptidyl-prolyl cis-trans isomerase [Flavobacteriaceae bacterium]|nr:peptidyl-prolyl cis-trans isomerase [Flavobacteriaceae bacterium]